MCSTNFIATNRDSKHTFKYYLHMYRGTTWLPLRSERYYSQYNLEKVDEYWS